MSRFLLPALLLVAAQSPRAQSDFDAADRQSIVDAVAHNFQDAYGVSDVAEAVAETSTPAPPAGPTEALTDPSRLPTR